MVSALPHVGRVSKMIRMHVSPVSGGYEVCFAVADQCFFGQTAILLIILVDGRSDCYGYAVLWQPHVVQ